MTSSWINKFKLSTDLETDPHYKYRFQLLESAKGYEFTNRTNVEPVRDTRSEKGKYFSGQLIRRFHNNRRVYCPQSRFLVSGIQPPTSLIEGTTSKNGLMALFWSVFSRAPSLAFPLNYGVIRKERSREEIIKLSSKEAATSAGLKVLIDFQFSDHLQGEMQERRSWKTVSKKCNQFVGESVPSRRLVGVLPET